MMDDTSHKRIALVAHDKMKKDMIDWVRQHIKLLEPHQLWATGTTGAQISEASGLQINLLKSGPLGGDQQLGAMIAEGKIDILIFLTDPLTPMPHDVDVKALLRISTLYQTVIACNRSTADYVILSERLSQPSDIRFPPLNGDENRKNKKSKAPWQKS